MSKSAWIMSTARWLCLALVILLAGCASDTPRAERIAQREAAYRAAAGAPVNNFRFFDLYSWEALGDAQVVIYTKPKEAWLLDVPGCTNLPFTNALAVTSNVSQVSVNFDKVLTGNNGFPCTISQIRPLDLNQFKLEKEGPRPIDTQPRPAASATDKP